MNPTRNDDLVRVVIGDVAESRLGWATGMRFSITRGIIEKIILSNPIGKNGIVNLTNPIDGISGTDTESLRLRAAFTPRKPATSRLPVSYQAAPPWLRSIAASIWANSQRRRTEHWAVYPQWPLDLSADFVDDLRKECSHVFDGGKTPVILTHDLDSPEGLRNYVDIFMGIEAKHGARSTCFVVPAAWEIDHGLVDMIARTGNELGVHGYDHSNHTAFAEIGEMRARLEAARPLIERYGASGYRSPSLLRTSRLMSELSKIYLYDSSVPTSGGLFPVPNNGCATARPFMIDGIAELPLSMPRDGMLRFMGYSPREIYKLWIDCAEKIAYSGGVVVLLTHCERRFSGNDGMLDTYKRFVEYISSSDTYKWSTPDLVLKEVNKNTAETKAGGDSEKQ